MATKKVSWRDVPVTNGEGRSADYNERLDALATCKNSAAGVPWDGWFFCPPEMVSKIKHRDDAHYFGPRAGDIDWAGFGVEVTLRALREYWAKGRSGLTWWLLCQLADIKEDRPNMGGIHAPSLPDALSGVYGRGPTQSFLEGLRAAGVRVNKRGGLPDPWQFFAPEAAPECEPVPVPRVD